MTDIAWEYLISRSKKRSKSLEIKQITMKELETVALETSWGPQRVMAFAKQSLDDGDKFFALNLGRIQYQIPISEVRKYFAPVPETEVPPPNPPGSLGSALKPEEKQVVKKKPKAKK